jgi:hypothetical protein
MKSSSSTILIITGRPFPVKWKEGDLKTAPDRASGEWPERHARFSFPEAFFEGTLQRGLPLWRAARMFELEPLECEGLEKMGIRTPIL